MSRKCAIAAVAISVLGLLACKRKNPTRCLAEALAQYELVRTSGSRDSCRAEYRAPDGRRAVVKVVEGDADLIGQPRRPVKFEKHVVFERREKGFTLVGWHHGALGILVRLEGAAIAEGPVLRAYLFHYPSDLGEELLELEAEARGAQHEAGRRPDAAAAYLESARKWLKAGKRQQALQSLYAALDADRYCYECYRLMHRLFEQKSQWDLAARAARRMTELKPDDPAPWLLLGDLFWKIRDGPKARKAYRKAKDLGAKGADLERASNRLRELDAGKYMIKVIRRPAKKGGGRD